MLYSSSQKLTRAPKELCNSSAPALQLYNCFTIALRQQLDSSLTESSQQPYKFTAALHQLYSSLTADLQQLYGSWQQRCSRSTAAKQQFCYANCSAAAPQRLYSSSERLTTLPRNTPGLEALEARLELLMRNRSLRVPGGIHIALERLHQLYCNLTATMKRPYRSSTA